MYDVYNKILGLLEVALKKAHTNEAPIGDRFGNDYYDGTIDSAVALTVKERNRWFTLFGANIQLKIAIANGAVWVENRRRTGAVVKRANIGYPKDARVNLLKELKQGAWFLVPACYVLDPSTGYDVFVSMSVYATSFGNWLLTDVDGTLIPIKLAGADIRLNVLCANNQINLMEVTYSTPSLTPRHLRMTRNTQNNSRVLSGCHDVRAALNAAYSIMDQLDNLVGLKAQTLDRPPLF
jgi:hypothetical protein